MLLYRWQKGRELASGTKGSTSFAYTYNADGLRTQKTAGTTVYDYYWDSGKLSAMTITNGSSITTLMFAYDSEGTPFAMSYNGTVYYYCTDVQGNVLGIFNEYGLCAYYEYDAWGNILTIDAATTDPYNAIMANPLRYRGYIYDADTELYYLQSRYYDPAIGRFLNADDVQFLGDSQTLLGYNLFVYCENDSVNKIDLSGFAVDVVFDVVFAVIGLGELIVNPSWLNFGSLVWDIASIFVPFLPGSYVTDAGKLCIKVANKFSDFARGSDLLMDSYKNLRKIFKGIKNIEIHHIIEKRFAKLFKKVKNTGDYLSIPLTKELHKVITKRWRDLWKLGDDFKYFKYGKNYLNITKKQMERAVRVVYRDMPELMEEALKWVRKNWKK